MLHFTSMQHEKYIFLVTSVGNIDIEKIYLWRSKISITTWMETPYNLYYKYHFCFSIHTNAQIKHGLPNNLLALNF